MFSTIEVMVYEAAAAAAAAAACEKTVQRRCCRSQMELLQGTAHTYAADETNQKACRCFRCARSTVTLPVTTRERTGLCPFHERNLLLSDIVVLLEHLDAHLFQPVEPDNICSCSCSNGVSNTKLIS